MSTTVRCVIERNRARRVTGEIVTVDGELTRSLAVDRHHHVVGLADAPQAVLAIG